MRLAACFSLAVLLAAPPSLTAQEPDTLDVRSAVALLREHGSSAAALALLTQKRGPRPQAELDALADSLVAIASSYRPDGPPTERRIAQSARSTLGTAGRADRPTPYAGALAALVRIYENVPEIRGGTLSAISRLRSTGPVIDFLAEVATTGDTASVQSAISHLYYRLGPAGLARLRRLYESDAIVDDRGRGQIAAIARLEGWGG